MAVLLLVDDYAPNHRLMRFILERSGHTVVTAFDGAEALDRLAVTPIDLVITDMLTHATDNVTLIHQLRGDTRYANLPIMLLTARSMDHKQMQLFHWEVDAFLTKPIHSAELTNEVERLVRCEHNALRQASRELVQTQYV